MGHKKLIRFEEIKQFSNVFEYPENKKGNWKYYFLNDNPIILELACGRGEYAVGLGELHPENNYIGIDIKGNRLWKGAKYALEHKLSNVAFLRIPIDQIYNYFEKDEISEIWITFPDPQLRLSRIKKRLTHPKFLQLYGQILKPKGVINLKTDSTNLFEFTKKVIQLYDLELKEEYDDVNNLENIPEALRIKTRYESLDISGSHRIYYQKFSLDGFSAGNEEKEAILKNSCKTTEAIP